MTIFGSTTTVETGSCWRSDSSNFDNFILIVISTAGTPNLGLPTLYLKNQQELCEKSKRKLYDKYQTVINSLNLTVLDPFISHPFFITSQRLLFVRSVHDRNGQT